MCCRIAWGDFLQWVRFGGCIAMICLGYEMSHSNHSIQCNQVAKTSRHNYSGRVNKTYPAD